ncbi:hypothetical protein M885DRAFT_554029 [Pelagophyceae sp. CCMP2097]|nr:hypothetical protein M885DRAFT_554029 [Pelagophyceae sp. CCMP2097]
MKFVVLLSGGKDSVFSVVECERYGHECVCAANLHPYEAVEEIDSHTFQSVCSSVVPGVAECLGVPLVRRALRGTAACQSLVYAGAAAGDEVEDLYDLLADVKKAHPEVAAVASGAILSTYQRTRVEDVCSRLGLRSLSYLWMRPQRALLREMRKVRAIVVKTASLGLEPETDLGLRLDLASTRAKFRRLHDRFGFHECGEGGEYESLVLDCARFKRRLVLDETEVLR